MALLSGLRLRIGDTGSLTRYVARQLDAMFPCEGEEEDIEELNSEVAHALERMRPILASVRNFECDCFDHFHSLQYATFLYLLANQCWRARGNNVLSNRLFMLNRALGSIDLYYTVELPPVFFLSHALATVLGGATYDDRLVIFQGVTVGRVGEARPRIGRNVVLYPGATVTGGAVIGDNCVIGAGVNAHELKLPDDSVVSQGPDGLQVSVRRREYAALYFR